MWEACLLRASSLLFAFDQVPGVDLVLWDLPIEFERDLEFVEPS